MWIKRAFGAQDIVRERMLALSRSVDIRIQVLADRSVTRLRVFAILDLLHELIKVANAF